MTRKQKRLAIIGGGLTFIGAAVMLVMFALRQEIVFFNMPSDVAAHPVPPEHRIRLGGLVEAGSVRRGDGSTVTFAVMDSKASIPVTYTGILPDLFREGQGVVTEGKFVPGSTVFVADTVLAKHDENYMPKEVADRLKQDGVWKGQGQ